MSDFDKTHHRQPVTAGTATAAPSTLHIQHHVVHRPSPVTRILRWLVTVLPLLYIAWQLYASQLNKVSPAERLLPELRAQIDKCDAASYNAYRPTPDSRALNPRWNARDGANSTIILRNATLFDGDAFHPKPVDITFHEGLIVSVSPSAAGSISDEAINMPNAKVMHLRGRYVTPGLVDMHSHHMIDPWPVLPGNDDSNEMGLGPVTPFLNVLDGIKADDASAVSIASGGVTTSLILPGSANIMGGEGVPVKNALRSGATGEPVVGDLLLEYGVPEKDRSRYLKVASGENPRAVYGYTRMGTTWLLRQHLSSASAIRDRQDRWCAKARSAATRLSSNHRQREFLDKEGGFPEDAVYEPAVALLRGQAAMHNHNYRAEDMETMLRMSRDFGFRIGGFHHATSAWQIPRLLKSYEGSNITIATWADLGDYKAESYSSSLEAARILDEHGIPVAFKSDNFLEGMSAKYLMHQAGTAHSFGLPEERSLQAVTSVPAKAIDQGHRIGYVRVGYDADVVVWDAHPLTVGATPMQVYIDGVATLDEGTVAESSGPWLDHMSVPKHHQSPHSKVVIAEAERSQFCSKAMAPDQSFVITGIKRSFLTKYKGTVDAELREPATASGEDLILVIDKGRITCLGLATTCNSKTVAVETPLQVNISNGSLLPGLTHVSDILGMQEMSLEPLTGGGVQATGDWKNSENVPFAKNGVFLEGKGFERAKLGGVTRVITPPLSDGSSVQGVSTGLRPSGVRDVLSGGIFQDDVAMHMLMELSFRHLPQGSLMAVQQVRQALEMNRGKSNETVYGKVADGQLPLVLHVKSKVSRILNKDPLAQANADPSWKPMTMQAIRLKRDFPDVRIVVHGGHSAPHFAKELANASIPVILSSNRGGPQDWTQKDALVGPPLTPSPARILSDHGVRYGITVTDGESGGPVSDTKAYALALEAAWAAKYAGLSDAEAVDLVAKNIEDILGLQPSEDFVVWEGNPLEFGSVVVLSFEDMGQGHFKVGTCWPQ